MIVTSRHFQSDNATDKIDLSQRELRWNNRILLVNFTQNLAREVEDEISKWNWNASLGEGDAKYKADCSNCKKSTMVPFEPKEGRPVYCKECMFKIKSGELNFKVVLFNFIQPIKKKSCKPFSVGHRIQTYSF